MLNISYIWYSHKFQHLAPSQVDEHQQVQIRKQDNITPKSHLEITQKHACISISDFDSKNGFLHLLKFMILVMIFDSDEFQSFVSL